MRNQFVDKPPKLPKKRALPLRSGRKVGEPERAGQSEEAVLENLELTIFGASNLTDKKLCIQTFANDLLEFLQSGEKFQLKLFARSLFKFADLQLLAMEKITKLLKSATLSKNAKWNLLIFFKSLPLCGAETMEIFFKDSSITELGLVERLPQIRQSAWLRILSMPLSSKMHRFIAPHFVEFAMDFMPNSEFFADFLYKIFREGNYLAILSLAGILKLINRNFEHPKFYDQVCQLMRPNICYSKYVQRFFDLVDLILTSTHVPVYILAAFLKKLSRILLFAPLPCQLPLLNLIKNVLSRHGAVHALLLNRDKPEALPEDLYNEDAAELKDSRAQESSLWELKALQSHWYGKVAYKASFINGRVQDEEVSLGWRDGVDLFATIHQKIGNKLIQLEKELGWDEDERTRAGPLVKRRRKNCSTPLDATIPPFMDFASPAGGLPKLWTY